MAADGEREYGLYVYESTPDGVKFVLVRELTRPEFEAADQALRVVHEVLRGFDAYVSLAIEDFDATIRGLTEQLAVNRNRWAALEYLPELEYRAMSVSVALRMYEEHVHSEVNRRCGKGSIESRDVEARFHFTYDSSLAYRVIYYLRNPLVHSSARLFRALFRQRLVAGDQVEGEVKLQLSRRAFVETDVKSAVREEVRSLPDDPDLVELVDELRSAMVELNAQLSPWLHPELPAATSLLWGYIQETAQRGAPRFHSHAPSDPLLDFADLPMTESAFFRVIELARRGSLVEP